MLKRFIKRFFLILFGILLSLAVLELSIRFAGVIISNYQNYRNTKVLKNKSKYTIMCIGESTTFRQYPIQLQKILDKKYPNKFSVIDCGIPGTILEIILDMLNDNIKKYNPDITICMMGINDYININYHKIVYNKLSTIKIYKLYLLLQKYFLNLFSNNAIASAIDTNNIKVLEKSTVEYYYKGDYLKCEKMAKTILYSYPLNEQALYMLATLYFFHIKDIEQAYTISITAINNNIKLHRQKFYIIAIKYNLCNNIPINTLIEKIISDDILLLSDQDNLLELYSVIKQNLNSKQQEILLNRIKSKTNDIFYGALGIDALEQKDYSKANQYFSKAEKIRLQGYDQEINNKYNLIIKQLINNNIKVICMQYPVRSVNFLKNILKYESYYDKITFISNEQNFKEALMTKQYDEIFVDQFGGDFGHCTDLGNTMIAENVANTLEKLVN